MQMWIQSLGKGDPLEKEMVTHSSILCLGNPTDRGAWWATVHRVAKRLDLMTKQQMIYPKNGLLCSPGRAGQAVCTDTK